jgi:GT2 family glycosyltransferase
LLLLNDDTEVINADWLECMLEYSQQAQIGAVGAKLFFANGRIQHAGVDILQGIPVHSYYDYPADHVGNGFATVIPRNCSAVTGACLMTRRHIFQEIGGFDLAFPYLFNDIDYCLKVRQGGRRIVITPYAQLYHYESSTRRGKIEVGQDLFQARWVKGYPRDPYYNPNLSVEYPDYRIDPDAVPQLLDPSADSIPCPPKILGN